jgi:hypothetical protein
VYFERALAVARKQQAKSWELCATMSMARLLRDQGKRDEACEFLAPVYGWFTEGFDTLPGFWSQVPVRIPAPYSPTTVHDPPSSRGRTAWRCASRPRPEQPRFSVDTR